MAVLLHNEVQYNHGAIHLQLFCHLLPKANIFMLTLFWCLKQSSEMLQSESLTHVSMISCGLWGLPVTITLILTRKKLSGPTAGGKTQEGVSAFCHYSDDSVRSSASRRAINCAQAALVLHRLPMPFPGVELFD